MTRRNPEYRWVVAKDYYKDGDNLRDDFPILYGSKTEAEELMARLNAGSDLSFFDPNDCDAFLFVDQIMI